MLAYILGIKGITNLGRFYGLQIGGENITNRNRGFKLGQRDLKSGQERLKNGARISIWGRDYKSVQSIVQQFLNTWNPNTVSTPKSVYEFLPSKGYQKLQGLLCTSR